MVSAVADTSVLVAFSAIRRLDLLRAIFPEIAVPKAVFREIVTDGCGWAQAVDVQSELERSDWLLVKEASEVHKIESFGRELGAGESEVIELALENGLPALIDDRRARETAERSGIKVIGTLGVLERNKRGGNINLVKPLVEGMRSQGIYFGDSLLTRFLQSTDET